MTTRRTLRTLVATAAPALIAGAAAAQTALTPPAPDLNREQSPLLGYGLMFVLTAVVVGISLLPSKRGHQD